MNKVRYNIEDYSSELWRTCSSQTKSLLYILLNLYIYSLNRPLQEFTNFPVIIYERNIIEHIIIFIYNIKLYVTTNIMYKMFQKYIVSVHNSTRGNYSGFEKYLHLL